MILPTPVPLVTGSTSPDRVTLSLRAVVPTVPLAGCGEVDRLGVDLTMFTVSAVQALQAPLLLASPE